MPAIPNADQAIVDSEKLIKYLFSFEHPIGKAKAAFFKNFGYHASNWKVFENDLRMFIRSRDISSIKVSSFGTNYVIQGSLSSPSGETIDVCTIWVILKGENIPRFVTAYSGGRK